MVIFRMGNAGVKNIGIVLNRNDGITGEYVKREYPDIEIFYQEKPSGFGDAIFCGREMLDKSCIVNAGDGLILDSDYYVRMTGSRESRLTLFEVENPSRYGNARIDEERKMVIEVREKPEKPLSRYAMAAIYFFREPFMEYVSKSRTEFTEYIQNAISSGYPLSYNIIDKKEWISVGNVEKYVECVEKTYKYFKKD